MRRRRLLLPLHLQGDADATDATDATNARVANTAIGASTHLATAPFATTTGPFAATDATGPTSLTVAHVAARGPAARRVVACFHRAAFVPTTTPVGTAAFWRQDRRWRVQRRASAHRHAIPGTVDGVARKHLRQQLS